MKWPLLTALILQGLISIAQDAHLQVIKNGKIKKRIHEGTVVKLTDFAGNIYIGPFRIINDSNLLIANVPVKINDMVLVQLYRGKKKQGFDWARFAYTTLGVALSTAGMTLSKWEDFDRALLSSAVLGYSSYALSALTKMSLKKRKFHRNNRIRFRIWSIERYDLPLRPKAAF